MKKKMNVCNLASVDHTPGRELFVSKSILNLEPILNFYTFLFLKNNYQDVECHSPSQLSQIQDFDLEILMDSNTSHTDRKQVATGNESTLNLYHQNITEKICKECYTLITNSGAIAVICDVCKHVIWFHWSCINTTYEKSLDTFDIAYVECVFCKKRIENTQFNRLNSIILYL